MLRNYLLIAYRNLWRNKVHTLINVLGLAIGLTAALFIFQYVQFEKSYDNFHAEANNICRLITQVTYNGVQESPQHRSMSPVAPALNRDCPEILEYARMFQNHTDNFIISYQAEDGASKEFLEQKVYYVDASFMKMFSFPMIAGNPVKSLEEPNALLLSESMAKKFFGVDFPVEDIIGQTLIVNGKDNFIVKGVFRDIPENSHIKFEILLSLTTLRQALNYDVEWHFGFLIYLKVAPGTDLKKLEADFLRLWEEYSKVSKRPNFIKLAITLQPVRKAHLHSSGFKKEPEIRGSNNIVQFLAIIAFFILILAWINYVNLSTAGAVKRAKEVGIRKVVGAGRRQLILQFLLEAFLINVASLVMAATLYQLGFRYFTNLVQKAIPANSLLEEFWFLPGIVLVLVLGTLLSGGYSAFMLSSLKAASIIKGRFYASEEGTVLRKGLIVFQFIISVGLISGTFGVHTQVGFMKSQGKGFDPSQKLIVRIPGVAGENYTNHYGSFKTSLQKLPDIGQITCSFLSPGDARGKGDYQVSNKDGPEKNQIFPINVVDEDYLKTYKIQLLHGRGFSKEFPSDKDAAVITEDVALQMGFDPAETALQKKIVVDWLKKEVSIIGIAKNINLYSLHRERTGVIFILGVEEPIFSGTLNYLTIETNVSHLRENLVSIEGIYKSHFPGIPFTYFFLDDYFNAQYRAEEQYGKAFTIASCLAIFIACLGLFGLSSFMVQQRTKEIGIRKVLGATIQNILMLLSKDYIILVCLAGLIALPLAYFSLNWWLESYMYRIELSWWLFAIPVVIVIGIALFTVCFQTIRAALTNPANVLKNE